MRSRRRWRRSRRGLAQSAGQDAILYAGAATTVGLILTRLLLPITLLQATKYIDGTWTLAVTGRADAAGVALADALCARSAIGERPVTLVGYSLGARVVFSWLEELAREGTRGRRSGSPAARAARARARPSVGCVEIKCCGAGASHAIHAFCSMTRCALWRGGVDDDERRRARSRRGSVVGRWVFCRTRRTSTTTSACTARSRSLPLDGVHWVDAAGGRRLRLAVRAGAGCGYTVGSNAKVSSRARRLFGSASENDEPDALLAGTRDLRAAPGEPLAWSGPDNISASVEIDCAARDAVVDIALVASSSSYETTASHEPLAANRFPRVSAEISESP